MGVIKDFFDSITKGFRDTVEYFFLIILISFIAGEFYVLWALKINHPTYIWYPVIFTIIYMIYFYFTRK